jgi:hypothetical protein
VLPFCPDCLLRTGFVQQDVELTLLLDIVASAVEKYSSMLEAQLNR